MVILQNAVWEDAILYCNQGGKESAWNVRIGPIQCLTFSADGLLGAAAGLDGKVVVWDLA